jgi:hypothetical protein
MKLLLRFSFCIFLLSLGLFFTSHYIMELGSTQALSQAMRKYHLAWMLWHYSLYLVVVALWPYFIGLIAKRQHWSEEVKLYLSNQRLKLIIFFVLIELLLVHNLLGQVIAWL